MLLGILCAANNTEEIKGNGDVQQYRTFKKFELQETATVKRQHDILGNTNLLYSQLGTLNATNDKESLEHPPTFKKSPTNDFDIRNGSFREHDDLNSAKITDQISNKSLISILVVSEDLPNTNKGSNKSSYDLPNPKRGSNYSSSYNFPYPNNISSTNNSDDLCNLKKYSTNISSHGWYDANINMNKTDQNMTQKHSVQDLNTGSISNKKLVRPNPHKKRCRSNTTKNHVGINNKTNNMASDSQHAFVRNLMSPARDTKEKLTVADVKKVNLLLAGYLTICIAVYVVNLVICIVISSRTVFSHLSLIFLLLNPGILTPSFSSYASSSSPP
ncbi:hypothetical protein WDU94_003740 [Cyamophila willieti]